jgi:hypothetical protein
MLAVATIKRTASGLRDALNRFTTMEAWLSGSAIDLKLVGKIAGLTIGMDEIADRAASGCNRFGQYLLDDPGQL